MIHFIYTVFLLVDEGRELLHTQQLLHIREGGKPCKTDCTEGENVQT